MNPSTTPLTNLPPGMIGISGQNFTPVQVAPTPAVVPPVLQPVTTSPTVSTSNTARTNVATSNDYLDTAAKVAKSNADYAAAQRLQANQLAQQQAIENAKKKTGETNYNSIASLGGVDLSNASINTRALSASGATSAEIAQAQKNANIQKIQGQMDQLQANMDARTSATIEGIKKEYSNLIEEQTKNNEAYQKGIFTAGLVSGREQYAPEIQAGITTQAVTYGLKQIQNIQDKRNQLINEAEAARDERNYKLLTTKMEAIRQNYKDEQAVAQALVEETRKAAEADRQNIKFTGESLAPIVSRMMTGDEATDIKTIQEYAKANSIPTASLYQYVDAYKTDQSKNLGTSDIKEFEYAINRGDIPQSTTLQEWQRTQANLKARASGTDSSTKAEQAFALYGDVIQKALAGGASPSEAVVAAAAYADAAGVKLDLNTQTDLKKRAEILASGGSKSYTGGEVAPLPGEVNTDDTIMEFLTGLIDPYTADTQKKNRLTKESRGTTIKNEWENLKSIPQFNLTDAQKQKATQLLSQARSLGITLTDRKGNPIK